MKIGEVAQRLGVSTRTLRHYERLGLVGPANRTAAGYREYDSAELLRLEQVLSLVTLDIPLAVIKRALDRMEQAGIGANQQIEQLVEWQQELVTERIERLQELQAALHQLQFTLRLNPGGPLNLVHSIAQAVGRNAQAKRQWRDRWGFDRWANSYDQELGSGGSGYLPHQNYWEVLRQVAELVPPTAEVLDIGIGTGNLSQLLIAKGARVVGVDQSREMLLRARQKLPGTQLLEGNFLALPVPDRSVDAVVTTYALHHLPEPDKRLAIAEMVRVLRPGGRIIIGDNMFLDQAAREAEHQRVLAAGQTDVWADIEDEYLGEVERLRAYLAEHGLPASCRQLADWTWMVWTPER